MPRIVHFEIHADDPDRAAKFYTDVFGWSVSKWGGPGEFWSAITGSAAEPGINGVIMRRKHPQGSTYNSVQVDDLSAYSAKIVAQGGRQVVPRMAIAGFGYLAYFQDTEGNVFGVFQSDSDAP